MKHKISNKCLAISKKPYLCIRQLYVKRLNSKYYAKTE